MNEDQRDRVEPDEAQPGINGNDTLANAAPGQADAGSRSLTSLPGSRTVLPITPSTDDDELSSQRVDLEPGKSRVTELFVAQHLFWSTIGHV